MGLYDEIRWDAELPERHPADDRIFQTKFLDPCLEHFVVTPEKRLVLVGNGLMEDDLATAKDVKGVDVAFHGDIRLSSVKSSHSYLARFTHGTLEWIRPLAPGEPYDPVGIARMKFPNEDAASKAEEP